MEIYGKRKSNRWGCLSIQFPLTKWEVFVRSKTIMTVLPNCKIRYGLFLSLKTCTALFSETLSVNIILEGQVPSDTFGAFAPIKTKTVDQPVHIMIFCSDYKTLIL